MKQQHKMVVKYPQYETAYNTVSEEAGIRQCANCRWFAHYGEYRNHPACQIVEEYPLPILATGLCNRHEPLPDDVLPQPPEPLEVEVINLAPIQERGTKDRILGRKNKYGMTFSKADDGLRLAVIVTSNGYKDREKEHVATKALEAYVESCYDEQGEYVGNNVLDFWHDKQLNNIGQIVGAWMVDGFLVEVAKERPHPVVKAIWDYWQTTAEDESVDWGASHEFISPDKGIYETIEKRKTSILPIEAAANLATAGVILT